MNIVSCYLTRFFLGVEKVLATYSHVMMWAYIPFALCVLLYVLCFTIEVGSFAVNITDEELQNIVESVGMKDVAEVAYFRRVVHRQSVAVDIFTDSAVDLSMIMFYMPPCFLLLVARNGRVPCFLMGGERGVKWLPWIAVCFLVFASMGLAIRSGFDLLVSSQKLMETEQFLIELFQAEPGIAIVDLFARRRALAACSILLLVAVMVIAISFLVIPFLRVLWAKRYCGVVQETEGSVHIDTVK